MWRRLRRLLPGRTTLRRIPLRSMTSEWDEVQDMLSETRASAASYQFRKADCNVLVVYALLEGGPEPSPRSASFVFGFAPETKVGVLAAPRAPHTCVVSAEDLMRAVEDAAAAAATTPATEDSLGELGAWIEEVGECDYGYQLEPPAICGEGIARPGATSDDPSDERSAAAAPAKRRSSWPDDDASEDSPACPACASADTSSRYTTAIGGKFTEAVCRACDHYWSWFG